MNTKNLLHTNREAVRILVLEKLGKSESDMEKDKVLLKKWIEFQKQLPEIPCDNFLEVFLIVNKFNLEKCKKKISNYYGIRHDMPELYIDKNPKLDHMQSIANVVYAIPLPKLTPSLSRVTVIKLKDIDPEKFNIENFIAHTYNVVEIRVREDMVLTDTVIYDMEGIQLGHLLKIRLAPMRKAVKVLEMVFSTRLEALHYINIPSSMQVLLNFVKAMLKEKMRKRIHVHKDWKQLHKHVPEEVLPEDYGGKCLTLNVLHGLWVEKFEECQELFDYIEKFARKEDKREGETIDSSINHDLKNICID
ncbi:hypothetical protein ABEB36_007580 [Hypothenemus hampei]|uniref:CRAL-TRIO domain-containing protein n=1 Tax=Hypothenemus hampei TaxID=57062 RepID=A0ABD1EXK2_HYPHA